MNKFDLIILSTFSKGIWLANEVVAQNKKVAFIDFTDRFPALHSEDILGPFGLFLTEEMDFFQKEWWKQYYSSLENGFCLITPRLPFHFKQTLLYSTYNKHQAFKNLRESISNSAKMNKSFDENWMTYLFHQLWSGVQDSMNKIILHNKLNLFNDFAYLNEQPSISTLDPRVYYLKPDPNHLQSIISGGSSFRFTHRGVYIEGEHLFSTLNPEESRMIGSQFCQQLFSKSNVPPSYYWQKWNFHFKTEGYPIPDHLVIASPEDLPWTHERLLVVQKRSHYKNQVNVWTKLPLMSIEELQQSSLESDIENKLKEVFLDLPIRKNKAHFSITPSFLFPIYSRKNDKKILAFNGKNYTSSWNPNNLSCESLLSKEREILKQLTN